MLPLLIGFVLLQGLIFALDIWALRRDGKPTGGRPPFSTVAFVSLVIGVFLAVQFGGAALVPGAEEIFDFLRGLTANDQAAAESTFSLVQQILLSVSLYYVVGFWDYVVHRFFSHSRWFWPTHEYHHLPSELSVVMPGILGRPFAFIPGFLATLATGLTVLLVSVMRGEAMWDIGPIIPVVLVILTVQTASHSYSLRQHWWLHRCFRWLLLTTPQEHVLHHAVDSDCNYGTFTSCWDRLFGTYGDPDRVDLESVSVGLSYDQDFLGTLTFSRWKLPAALRKKFDVDRFCHIDKPDS